MKGGLCNVGYMYSYNLKDYANDFFCFSGVEKHAYNFEPLHIEMS
jgi:hypothetical protein